MHILRTSATTRGNRTILTNSCTWPPVRTSSRRSRCSAPQPLKNLFQFTLCRKLKRGWITRSHKCLTSNWVSRRSSCRLSTKVWNKTQASKFTITKRYPRTAWLQLWTQKAKSSKNCKSKELKLKRETVLTLNLTATRERRIRRKNGLNQSSII